jgi:hypothetical protein
MRKHAVADDDAEAAGVERGLVSFGDRVDVAGKPKCVFGPAPRLPDCESPMVNVWSISVIS